MSVSPSPGRAPRRSLVLASASPYRRQLLARLGLSFRVDAAAVDESPLPGEPAPALARRLAAAKAAAVAARHPDALVIGSDQVAVLGGRILGKPGGFDAALAQLRAASGRRVDFYTGLSVLDSASGRRREALADNSVVLRRLSRERLAAYLRRERPYDCAGSFKAEGLGVALFERQTGDDPNALIGLPLIALCALLEDAGVYAF